MQLNPARGRKLKAYMRNIFLRKRPGFMQLNPARRRKPVALAGRSSAISARGLCSSTPRGDGNSHGLCGVQHIMGEGLCSSTPRGDGNSSSTLIISRSSRLGLCSSTPRGDGNSSSTLIISRSSRLGLCSSTPRGDGNNSLNDRRCPPFLAWFMQLNPARGRKLVICRLCPHSFSPIPVYAAQPREGTETYDAKNIQFQLVFEVYAAQPREGTETRKRPKYLSFFLL